MGGSGPKAEQKGPGRVLNSQSAQGSGLLLQDPRGRCLGKGSAASQTSDARGVFGINSFQSQVTLIKTHELGRLYLMKPT